MQVFVIIEQIMTVRDKILAIISLWSYYMNIKDLQYLGV